MNSDRGPRFRGSASRGLRVWSRAALWVLFAVLGPAEGASAPKPPPPDAPMRELLRRTVESSSPADPVTVAGELIYSPGTLRRFYEERLFHPAWVKGGEPFGAVDELVDALRRAEGDGLQPSHYHLDAIVSLREQTSREGAAGGTAPDPLTELELLCTDAFVLLGSHLLGGRVHPETFDLEWEYDREKSDFAAVLREALASGGVSESLRRLAPPQEGYRSLKEALARYRAMADSGGWPEVPPGPALRENDRGPRVEALRRILAMTGDLPKDSSPGSDLFDGATLAALRSFQERHGLEVDGVAGRSTLGSLNVPASRRARQIGLNLERWRWLPRDLGRRHIIVNIADYRLDVFEDGRKVMTLEVVVGQPFRRTPVFSSRITYLVFNPYWNVPRDIAVKDKLPLIRKDPAYLAAQGIRILQGWGAETREVDQAAVDWGSVGAGNFPYRLRQDPGPNNALGRVKFMFPNKFDVYLHDTPSQELFDKRTRPYSSGCIRVQRPLELAAFLLGKDAEWISEALAAAVERGEESTVGLPEPVPLHLLYWTAWVGKDGKVQFREDIYRRDRKLEGALLSLPSPGR